MVERVFKGTVFIAVFVVALSACGAEATPIDTTTTTISRGDLVFLQALANYLGDPAIADFESGDIFLVQGHAACELFDRGDSFDEAQDTLNLGWSLSVESLIDEGYITEDGRSEFEDGAPELLVLITGAALVGLCPQHFERVAAEIEAGKVGGG